jgi:hypothetical protein
MQAARQGPSAVSKKERRRRAAQSARDKALAASMAKAKAKPTPRTGNGNWNGAAAMNGPMGTGYSGALPMPSLQCALPSRVIRQVCRFDMTGQPVNQLVLINVGTNDAGVVFTGNTASGNYMNFPTAGYPSGTSIAIYQCVPPVTGTASYVTGSPGPGGTPPLGGGRVRMVAVHCKITVACGSGSLVGVCYRALDALTTQLPISTAYPGLVNDPETPRKDVTGGVWSTVLTAPILNQEGYGDWRSNSGDGTVVPGTSDLSWAHAPIAFAFPRWSQGTNDYVPAVTFEIVRYIQLELGLGNEQWGNEADTAPFDPEAVANVPGVGKLDPTNPRAAVEFGAQVPKRAGQTATAAVIGAALGVGAVTGMGRRRRSELRRQMGVGPSFQNGSGNGGQQWLRW